jgi:hypothetical protein
MMFIKARSSTFALCILLALNSVSFATVPTCEDIDQALTASSDFSKWRGKQISDGEWDTPHSIFGFEKCVVTKRDFRCGNQAGSSLELAKASFNTFRELLEKCLPKPEWIHKRGDDALPTQSFINRDGRNGGLSLIKLQELKSGTVKLQLQDVYLLSFTILERM